MKPLIGTSKLPPKGWVYREVIGGRSWTNPDTMLPFWDVVAVIERARWNNPNSGLSTNPKEIAAALASYTCKRLNFDSRWCATEMTAEEAATVARKGKRGCVGCGATKKK